MTVSSADDLRSLIREVPDFPKPGILFYDITTLLKKPDAFREVIDLTDWDRSTATSVPGQSGQPGSPHYGDLLPLWGEGRYFPLLYSREAIEKTARERLVLEPGH